MFRFVKISILFILSALLLCIVIVFSAEAEAFGLPEELSRLVDMAEDFSGYALLTADDDTLLGTPKDLSVFVLSRGNICVLFGATEESEGWKLRGWTRQALYPTLLENIELTIRKIDAERFELCWPNERFSFYCGGTDHYGLLYDASIVTDAGKYIIQKKDGEDGLWFENGEKSIYWALALYQPRISWQGFNPLLFPKNFENVERSNAIFEVMPWSHMGEFTLKTKSLKKALTLYNLPDISNRIVDMSTLFNNNEFTYYGMYGEWHFIGYKKGIERAYFGYIQKKHLPLDKREQSILRGEFSNVSLTTKGETFLTDDPLLSQEPITVLPSGTALIGLSAWDAYYVYVEVALPNETIRGFVPIKNLLVE